MCIFKFYSTISLSILALAESWSNKGVPLHQGEPQLAQLGTTCTVALEDGFWFQVVLPSLNNTYEPVQAFTLCGFPQLLGLGRLW